MAESRKDRHGNDVERKYRAECVGNSAPSASTTVDKAAMADPPQIAVPTPIKTAQFADAVPAPDPSKYASVNTTTSVPNITGSDSKPPRTNSRRLSCAPRRRSKIATSVFAENVHARQERRHASDARRTATPITMPKTGAPISGNRAPATTAIVGNEHAERDARHD